MKWKCFYLFILFLNRMFCGAAVVWRRRVLWFWSRINWIYKINKAGAGTPVQVFLWRFGLSPLRFVRSAQLTGQGDFGQGWRIWAAVWSNSLDWDYSTEITNLQYNTVNARECFDVKMWLFSVFLFCHFTVSASFHGDRESRLLCPGESRSPPL